MTASIKKKASYKPFIFIVALKINPDGTKQRVAKIHILDNAPFRTSHPYGAFVFLLAAPAGSQHDGKPRIIFKQIFYVSGSPSGD